MATLPDVKTFDPNDQDQVQEASKDPCVYPGFPDLWGYRNEGLRCRTCMFFVLKKRTRSAAIAEVNLGRCRRHAPTMQGYPVVYENDFCGDHKLDENK